MCTSENTQEILAWVFLKQNSIWPQKDDPESSSCQKQFQANQRSPSVLLNPMKLIGSTLKSSVYLIMQLLQWTLAHSHTLLHWNCLSVSVSPFDWKLLEGRGSIIFLLYPQSLAPCSVHEWSLKNDEMMAPVYAPTPCPQLLIPTQCQVRKLHCAKSTVVPCVAQVLQNCKVCD